MANKNFFQIGDTDLTPFCDVQNHKVNSTAVTRRWTDGNWIDRESLIRRRIEGTVTLGFQRAADEAAFMALLNTYRQADGWYPVTVYVQNTGETARIEAFLTTEATATWDFVNNAQWKVVTVDIYER